MNKIAVAPFLLSLFIFGCQGDEKQTTSAADLVSAFGSSCVTSATWSQQALSHSQAIATVIQNIQKNDPCAPFQGSLGAIQAASQEIQSIVQDPAYVNYRNAEENVQTLSLVLQTATPGSDLSTAIQSALVQAQVTLAQAQANNIVDQSTQKRDRYAVSTAALATFSQQMLSQSQGLAQCLKSSPSIAMELATNLMAIGGSFVSPVFGAGASVVGQLVNFAVEYARQSGEADALWQLDQVQMPNALGCGLESMSELYCDASDAMDLLALQPAGQLNHPVPDFWVGTDLLTNRIPVLDTWLLSIRNGLLPTNPQESTRQDLIWQKLGTLDQTYRDVYALQAQNKNLYDASSSDPANQQNILVRTLTNSIAYLMPSSYTGSTLPPNPFSDQTMDMDVYLCWLVLGPALLPPDPKIPNDPKHCPAHIVSDPTDTGEKYIRNHLLQFANFDQVRANWDLIYKKVQAAVEIEFAQTITANPDSILASAKEGAVDNVSPYEALLRTKNFLQGQLDHDTGANPNKVPFVKSLLALTVSALDVVDSPTRDNLSRITSLFTLFQLAHGTQYFDTSISQAVNWDLSERVKNHEFPTDVNDILVTSGEDIHTRLTAAGIKDLDAIQLDLNNARSITAGNLAVFREYFNPSFAHAIQYLKENAVSHGEPTEGANRPFGQTLGHLCTLILATGMGWPKDLPWDACSNAVLNTIYPDPNGKMTLHLGTLAQQLEGKPFETRVCAFHRFLRAGKYAELFGSSEKRVESSALSEMNLLNFVLGR